MKSISKPVYIFLFAVATLVYIYGLYIDVMEIDAAQYASLSHEMLMTKSYTMLHFRQLNYLDKPPLCFWLEALSFKIFGINNISYKLPSFLFTLLAVFSTYKLAKKLYSGKIARLSALILYTCQGFFLFNHDVRTDTILTGSIIFAIWQLSEYLETRNIINYFLGFTAIAAAMLAKGPLGLMVPVIAIAGQIIYKKQWKDFIRIEWLLGIVYVFILLLPFVWGLYRQFGAYGVKFYFWTQSFGRITGESQWHENGDYLFFVHTFVWSFLPWAFLSIFAVASTLKALLLKSKKFDIIELLTFIGAMVPFAILSLSKNKLPHYIFVLFPLFAILTASSTFTLINHYKFWRKFLYRVQLIMVILLWIMLYLLFILVFPCKNANIWTGLIILNLLTIYFIFQGRPDWAQIVIAPAITIIAVNFMLNTHFYPNLLKYQAGKSMAMSKTEVNRDIYAYNAQVFSYDFYAQKIVRPSNDYTIKNIIEKKKKAYIITNDEGMRNLINVKARLSDIRIYYNYPVTRLTLKFLNVNTRFKTLSHYFLVKIN